MHELCRLLRSTRQGAACYLTCISRRKSTMVEQREANCERFKGENHTAFVVGYTGETGKEIVKEMARAKTFKKVYLLGRRTVDLGPDVGPEFEQKKIDFEAPEQIADVFKETDVGFCTLGTTKKKAGSAEGFIKIDKTYCLNVAKVAKENGCKQFAYCSSNGANHNSSFLYLRVKGEVEEGLKEIGFERLSLYRPAMLMCDREERRIGERIFQVLLKPMAALCPTVGTIPTSVLAKGMLNHVYQQEADPVKTYENAAIHEIAGNVKNK